MDRKPLFFRPRRWYEAHARCQNPNHSILSPQPKILKEGDTTLVTMPASTSTVTTSTKASNGTAKLRGEPGSEEIAPPLNVKEHDFFWTYTEEPHRTRRMAIIKAHPEVHIALFNFRMAN